MSGRRPNGEGTIYQRRDGRWEGAAYVLLPSGGRARKRVYGKTRSEVFAKLAELQQKTRSGLPAISGQMTIATLPQRMARDGGTTVGATVDVLQLPAVRARSPDSGTG